MAASKSKQRKKTSDKSSSSSLIGEYAQRWDNERRRLEDNVKALLQDVANKDNTILDLEAHIEVVNQSNRAGLMVVYEKRNFKFESELQELKLSMWKKADEIADIKNGRTHAKLEEMIEKLIDEKDNLSFRYNQELEANIALDNEVAGFKKKLGLDPGMPVRKKWWSFGLAPRRWWGGWR